MEQISMFEFDIEIETVEPLKNKKRTIQWNPKRRSSALQIDMIEYDGFPDKALAKKIDNVIRNRSRILSEPFTKFIEVIGYQRFFDWLDKISYQVIIRVDGLYPYARILSVDLHNEEDQDLNQLLFFDYRHLRFESDPKKPWIFKSLQEKTQYLNWASKGI